MPTEPTKKPEIADVIVKDKTVSPEPCAEWKKPKMELVIKRGPWPAGLSGDMKVVNWDGDEL